MVLRIYGMRIVWVAIVRLVTSVAKGAEADDAKHIRLQNQYPETVIFH